MELKKGSRSGTKKKSRCQTELESYNNRNELTHCGKELNLAKDRPTRQLSSQLQAQQANEHREKSEPYSVSQRGREWILSYCMCMINKKAITEMIRRRSSINHTKAASVA